MKIRRIKIYDIPHKPLIDGLELSFPDNKGDFLNANCLIGINGSGKSQFLESIAELFLYLDAVYSPKPSSSKSKNPNPFLFEIVYSIVRDNKKYLVEIIQNKKNKLPLVRITDENSEELKIDDSQIEHYLPEKIIGYTSGENETISIPFLAYYDEYANYTANRAIQKSDHIDYEPRFYFMDYNTNLGIVISNLIFEESEGVNDLKKEFNIDKIKSFQITIQTNSSAAPNISINGEKGVVLTEDLKKWRSNLINSATCYDYDEKQNKYTLDFYVTDATKDAISFFFKSAYNFYTALYKFELLNNLMIDKKVRNEIEKDRKERRLINKMPTVPNKDKVLHYSELKLILKTGEIIDYLSLSDGEHQYFNIFGSIIMVNHDNSLFLLDEPETHFNPKWRRLFISHLRNLTKSRKQDLFLTSHSPFIVSDSPREFVYIFKRTENQTICIENPPQETFGASFDNILRMAFGLNETISKEASDKIKCLHEETDPEILESEIAKLGDSPNLMSLYRRIDMLSQD
jgi:restriction system-associated AAA family ATPase